jgi:hypothetical protein
MTKWVAKLPPEAWGTALSDVAAIWQQKDSATFSAWLAVQPVLTKDRIMSDWCASGSRDNPREVMDEAKNITDEALREEALTKYALSLGTTPDASIKLIRKTNLSDAEKTQLIRLIQERPNDDDEE